MTQRLAASTARATGLNGVGRFRLGIGTTLSIAFLAVAVLAAAANLISERGSQIVRTTRPPTSPAPVIASAPPPAVVITEPQIAVPRVVSPDTVLAATATYDQATQNRALIDDAATLDEMQQATDALQRSANDLLHNVRDRSGVKERRNFTGDLQNYRTAAVEFIQSADDRHSLVGDYSTRYDALHARARASIDGAWKVFGRVVARQALVTLNSQVEDLGRRSAALIARSADAEAAAAIASSETAIIATLTDNERSLAGSQGKDWVAAMQRDMTWLAGARERMLLSEAAHKSARERLTQSRIALERSARSIVIVRAAPKASTVSTAAATAPVAQRSQRGHHSPRLARTRTVTTTVDHDAGRKTLIAWISGGVLLLLVLICFVTVQSVVGPVRRLVRASARVAEGDLDARVPAGGIKELDTLAIAFNDMADRLALAERITRDYQAELEAKVIERTEQLKRLASNDPLTQLPNRRELFVLLNDALARAAENDDYIGVFFLDLDNFKNINDGMGHAFGDQVLQAMATRLQTVAAEFGFAARLGGDEFTVVMTDATSFADIRAAGMRLVDAFDEPLVVANRELVLSVSVGASVFPDHERSADALLRAADAAVFRAKALGRSQLTMYSPELLATAAAKFAIEQGLRRALEKGEFELVFQPELSLVSMQVELVEALIRWRQPDGRLAAPAEFLAVAEESGLIMDISDWVLRSAISTAASWHHGSWPDARVAINVSSRQLIDATFVQRVRSLLDEYRLPPRCIEIELTESVLQTGPVTLEALRQLRAHGIAIALDDFGTGYSSLSSLQQLPLTRIKLDRSLIEDIDSSPRSLAIARSIIALSRSLGLNVTAEGIERPEQLSLLLAEGSMFVQGYLLSRPLPEKDLIAGLTSVAHLTETLLLPGPGQPRSAITKSDDDTSGTLQRLADA